MVLRVILWILLGYFIYRFIFGFLVPVITVSRRMKQGVREFQRQQMQQQREHSSTTSSSQQKPSASTEKAGEYIDFEEVKEK